MRYSGHGKGTPTFGKRSRYSFCDCSRGSVVTIQAFCREAAGDIEDLKAMDTPSLNFKKAHFGSRVAADIGPHSAIYKPNHA